jgi:ribose 5-phosphate isomerase B
MKIYLGADHNGYDFKAQLLERLQADGHEVIDCGDLDRDQNDDFPKFASQVVAALRGDQDDQARGILVCGSGQGMCMAANRFKGIRASLCWDQEEARSARNDDDSNVLCLSARTLDFDATLTIVQTWLSTPFAGAPRFVRRLKELDELGN